jgi:hypothetical protein
VTMVAVKRENKSLAGRESRLDKLL